MNGSDYLNVSGTLSGKTVVLGISGGIAAYKSAEIVRLLKRRGANVQVVMTKNACRFIQPLTFQALSHRPVVTDMYDNTYTDVLKHTSLAEETDIVLVAPATANIIGKYASGIADDFLSTFLLAVEAPVLIAPAMNPVMYRHPAVQDNIDCLKQRGTVIIQPDTGDTACGRQGKGRLAEPRCIVDHVAVELGKNGDFEGYRLVVTAGPTREAIDPIRFLSNRSSGLMGYQLAAAAVERGASVVLITGPVSLVPHACVKVMPVTSAREMRDAVLDAAGDADVLIMAAAVADWEPKNVYKNKWKKGSARELQLPLKRTPDILEELGMSSHSFILVGFAAETTELMKNAEQKLVEKNVDVLVANDISKPGGGFQSSDNEVVIFSKDYSPVAVTLRNKRHVADLILDRIVEIRKR